MIQPVKKTKNKITSQLIRWALQELWWDLAKAFIVPVPLTVSELEPHKQRICGPVNQNRWRQMKINDFSSISIDQDEQKPCLAPCWSTFRCFCSNYLGYQIGFVFWPFTTQSSGSRALVGEWGNDQSFLLSILNDAQKCNHSWEVLQYVSEETRNSQVANFTGPI